MIKNYFIIAFRNLVRNKSYTFINVAGLALGITTCIIIFIIIKRELSFDQAFSNSKNIYRIVCETSDASGVEKTTITPYPLAEALKILSTLVITFATVGYRSLRAAIANPVDALKRE